MDSQAPAASALQLSTFTKIKSINRKDRCPEFPVTVSLAAPGADRPVRVPVDIVAAIDISHSSRTNAPMLELEKDVLRIVIDKLGPADRLAVVPFDSVVRVLRDKDGAEETATLVAMSHEGRKNVKGLVEKLKYTGGGGTNLIKPLNKAEKILTERADADGRAAFIILLSDGGDKTVLQDKVWDRESELKAGAPKYPVHTFGFTKHDRETLAHVAKKTNGTHYPGDIAGIGDLDPFDAFFEALLSAAASRQFSAVCASARLRAENGVRITRLDAGGKDAFISSDAHAGVDLGVINAGEKPEFTVYLDVPEGDADVMEVLAVEGSYTQGWDGKVVNLGPSIVSVKRPQGTEKKEEKAQKPETEETPQKPDTEKEKEKETTEKPEKEKETTERTEKEKETPEKPEKEKEKEETTKKPEKEKETPEKPEKEKEKETTEKPEKEKPQDPCKALYDIEERLTYWCKVKADLSAMDDKADAGAGNKCDCHFTAVQREAALESINRAMHHDIYTAVVIAIKTRRCGEAPSDKKAEASAATADK